MRELPTPTWPLLSLTDLVPQRADSRRWWRWRQWLWPAMGSGPDWK